MNRLINKIERIRVNTNPNVIVMNTLNTNVRNNFNTQTIMRGTHNV
jgi:hypothetical protein